VKKPNIILLILDSARRDMFGCYGNQDGLTPGIDALAQECLLLNDHYAAGCGSAQAHVSIFLGQHSFRHGVVHNMSEMKDDIKALPLLLKNAGYKNYGHCMASFIPPAGYEDLFGFDEFIYPGKHGQKVNNGIKSKLLDMVRTNPFLWDKLKGAYRFFVGQDGVTRAAAQNFDGKVSLDYLLKQIRSPTDDKPIFAYSTLLHPHTPYYPPKWCIEKVFKGHKIDKLSFEIQGNLHGWVNGDFGAAEQAIDSLKKFYQAELIYADHLISTFVDELRTSNVLDDSILIITSDHGELLGEHNQLNHGGTVWEEIFRLPFLIRFPEKFTGGAVYNGMTSALDIMPTLLDIIGLDELRQTSVLDGKSILELSQQYEERTLVVDAPPIVLPERLKAYPNVLARGSHISRAVRNSKYKYIWQSNGYRYLYPVGEVESDGNNRLTDKPEIVKEMHTYMEEYYKSIDPEADINQYPINMGTTAAMKMTNPAIRQELKKLGYL
jgi:arylsulfatase A-like enzyme